MLVEGAEAGPTSDMIDQKLKQLEAIISAEREKNVQLSTQLKKAESSVEHWMSYYELQSRALCLENMHTSKDMLHYILGFLLQPFLAISLPSY